MAPDKWKYNNIKNKAKQNSSYLMGNIASIAVLGTVNNYGIYSEINSVHQVSKTSELSTSPAML